MRGVPEVDTMSARQAEDPMANFPPHVPRPWCHHCNAPIGAADLSSPPFTELEGVPVSDVICARCLRGPDDQGLPDE